MSFSASDDPAHDGWRGWLLHSPAARLLSNALIVALSSATAMAFAVAVTALVRDRPTANLTPLLLLAVPILTGGQLWMIAWMNLRQGLRSGSWRERMRRQNRATTWPNPRTFFFGPLDARRANSLLALAFTGWLLGMTAFPAIGDGGPAGSGGGCGYRLDSHGSYTCVSKESYEHAGAGEQRFAAAIMLAFFAIETGAAMGGKEMQTDASA